MKAKIKEIETTIEAQLQPKLIGKVDDWIINGVKTWVRVFLPDIKTHSNP